MKKQNNSNKVTLLSAEKFLLTWVTQKLYKVSFLHLEKSKKKTGSKAQIRLERESHPNTQARTHTHSLFSVSVPPTPD